MYFCWTTSFEWDSIVGLRETGRTYWRIAAHVGHNVSVVFRCFQQSSVEHFHTRRPGSGRPRSTDARQDRRILRALVAALTASREEIWVHVATAVSPRTIGNRLLAAGLRSCVTLARLLWCRKGVDCSMECPSIVFSDESEFCLYVNDGRTRVRLHLVSAIFLSAFAHNIQSPT